MPSSAKITVLGHVGNTKLIKSDFVKFGVAVKNRDGTTSWFDVLTNDRYVIRHVSKGDLVLVQGFVEIGEFNGKKSVTVFAEEVFLLKKKEQSQEVAQEQNNITLTDNDDNPPF